MSASTKCVVDSVDPLRRSPLGHTPKNTRSPSGPRRTETSKQRLLPVPLSNNFAGRPTSPTGYRSKGFPKMRSWSLPKPTKTFRKLPGREQGSIPQQVRPCKGWWTHSQQGPPRRKQYRQTPEVKRGQHTHVPILASETPCSARGETGVSPTEPYESDFVHMLPSNLFASVIDPKEPTIRRLLPAIDDPLEVKFVEINGHAGSTAERRVLFPEDCHIVVGRFAREL